MSSVLDNIKLIKNHPNDFSGKRVLLRLDFNVLIKDGEVADDFRIEKILPTVDFLKRVGAKIIILGHIGRNKGDSLIPVCKYLKKKFEVGFIPDFNRDTSLAIIEKMSSGDVVMFENLRIGGSDEEENNNTKFAQQLSEFGDVYVNDAFAVCHREHASIVSLPKFLPSYAGLLFEKEIKHLEVAFNPPHPFLFILGGAKFKTKLPLIKKYIDIADYCFVGGALSHNFFKSKGYEIGKSLIDDTCDIDDLLNNEKLILPTDSVVESGNGKSIKKISEVSADDNIMDAGPETIEKLKELVSKSEFVLWNGPIGDYTKDGFEKGTVGLVKILAEKEFGPGKLILGGGDTASLISQMGMEENFPFISTGGGAMLEFLSKGTLPGIEALKS